MRLAVFSDIHRDANWSSEPDYAPHVDDDVDVIIVAGDVTAPCSASMRWAHRNFEGRPVVMVAGNHEHYGQVYERSMQSARDDRHLYPDVHFLENDFFVLGGVRFLGACLWTDFALHGTISESMRQAEMWMTDYRLIASESVSGMPRPFTAAKTARLHQQSRVWLERALATPFDGTTVVVTHTGPHPMSVAEQYLGDPLTPAFTSDLSDVILEHQPELWVHGHTHVSLDYVVPGTKTRVVCNPRGYLRTEFGRLRGDPENGSFDPGLVVEV